MGGWRLKRKGGGSGENQRLRGRYSEETMKPPSLFFLYRVILSLSRKWGGLTSECAEVCFSEMNVSSSREPFDSI